MATGFPAPPGRDALGEVLCDHGDQYDSSVPPPHPTGAGAAAPAWALVLAAPHFDLDDVARRVAVPDLVRRWMTAIRWPSGTRAGRRRGRRSGPYTLVMATVAIVDYDPTWPEQFEELAAALRRQLGDGVTGIDHIGSTAVPGLAAKDVIDLQVTVSDLAQADRLGPALERAGYLATPYRHDHRPAGDLSDPERWEKRLWQSPPGARRVNVHVRVAGWPNQRYALLFRDYLRAHPRAGAAYVRLKRDLAERFGDDLAAYTTLKDSACDLIVVAAEDWAAAAGR